MATVARTSTQLWLALHFIFSRRNFIDMDAKKQQGLFIGALIGAILGAGAAYLLMTSPANLEGDEEPEPIKAKDLLGLTGTVAILIRKLDDIRRKI
jgi:hypothetical protein